MDESDFDVESFRKPHESRHEWDLRRAFILAHHDQFPDNRLLCLANCFVSIECYGCQYPVDVMKQMEELGSVAKAGISRRKPMIGQPSGVKFVKSSDGADKKTNPSASLGEKEISAKKVSESERSRKPVMNCNSAPVESAVPMSATESKFYSLANCIRKIREKHRLSVRSDAEIIQMGVDKTKMVAAQTFSDDVHGFRCSLLIDCIFISSGEAQNKKAAKHLAFQAAAELLCKPYLKVEKIPVTSDDYRLVGSMDPFETSSSSPFGKETAKRPFRTSISTSISTLGQETKANVQCPEKRRRKAVREKEKRPAAAGLKELLAEFVVTERAENALTILHQSADRCHSEVSYEFLDLPDGKSRCTVSLNGIVLTDCVGDAGLSLKSEAAEVALKMLKEKCYTVVYKQMDQADASDAVQREEVIGDVLLQKQTIPESNIGNRLLKKIGWTGGGLGKEGNEGIVEPVSLESVINREGLGLNAERGISTDFRLKVAAIIQDYMQTDKQEDLVFAPTFSKEERVIIHQQSRKYHLINRSYGHDKDRYLVLSRKRTPLELVAHILANGGETKRFILKAPGSS